MVSRRSRSTSASCRRGGGGAGPPSAPRGRPPSRAPAPLPAGAVAADLVYVPLVTPLLAAAQARGLATADGLGMLLHQAVRGFSLWCGVPPTVTPELRALVEADLIGG